jgi:hypothetical protein
MYVSLADTGHGGPPHEVPFGRILPESFPVLDQLYTGEVEYIARQLICINVFKGNPCFCISPILLCVCV